MNNISVIIRNRNESEYIGFAIQSVIDHINNPEIIIVNNQSTDESMKIVSLFDKHNIKKYNINGNYTPGKALNYGVKKANNNTILVLSAHTQIIEVNIQRVEEILKHHQAVMGQQTPIYKGKKISKRYIWSHFTDEPCINMYSDIEDRQFLHNAFCFYDKKTLTEYPFNEKLSGKEDRYWAIDMVKEGHSYWYAPEFKCNHFYTPNGATWKGIG